MNKYDQYDDDDYEEFKQAEELEDKWHLVSEAGEGEITSVTLTLDGVKKYFSDIGCTNCWKDFIAHMKLEKDDHYSYRNYTLIPDSKYVKGNYERSKILAEKS